MCVQLFEPVGAGIRLFFLFDWNKHGEERSSFILFCSCPKELATEEENRSWILTHGFRVLWLIINCNFFVERPESQLVTVH